MKKIGIIFAMKEELEKTLEKITYIKKHKVYELVIYECKYNDNKCYLVESGIGKVNAARTTQLLITKMNVDCILNIGVAGSISKEVKKCDIVIANNLVQHDFDSTSFNHEKGLIPNVGKNIPCDEKMLSLAQKVKLDAIKEIKMSQFIYQ